MWDLRVRVIIRFDVAATILAVGALLKLWL
jgi:hypothetical protein